MSDFIDISDMTPHCTVNPAFTSLVDGRLLCTVMNNSQMVINKVTRTVAGCPVGWNIIQGKLWSLRSFKILDDAKQIRLHGMANEAPVPDAAELLYLLTNLVENEITSAVGEVRIEAPRVD